MPYIAVMSLSVGLRWITLPSNFPTISDVALKDIRAEYVQKTIAQQSNEHLNTTLEKIETVVNGVFGITAQFC
jgi:hypothetical protein